MASFEWPPTSGGGVQTYPTLSDFPAASANTGQLAIALDTGDLYESYAGSWQLLATPSDTVTTIGTLDSEGSPSANGATINANALILQSASGTAPGLVNTTTQTFAGQKTFSTGLTGTLTGHATLDVTTASLGTTTEATSAVLTLSGWTDATVGSPTIQVKQSGTSSPGYLSAADWNTFNGKQAAGSYITALTGDGTASGPGSAVFTLANVNTNTGTFASVTVNAKGLVTAAAALSGDATTSGAALTLASVNSNTGTFASATFNAKGLATAAANLSGDITTTGSAATLATVNSNVGSFTYASITVNGKGLVTAASSGAGPLINPMTTLGDIIYGGASGTPTRLPGNTTTTPEFYTSTGAAGSATAPTLTGSTGSGSVVLATSPTLVTPVLGTPSSGTLTSCTLFSGLTTEGLMYATSSSAATSTAAGTTGQIAMATTSSPPTWATVPGNSSILKSPTVQSFSSVASQTGVVIDVTTTGVTATAGAVYTNNGHSYTLLNSVVSSTGPLFFSGTSLWSGTSFALSSGTGPSNIVASQSFYIHASGTYTLPTSPSPLYIQIELVGAGGGGGGSSSSAANNGASGANGGTTTFGTSLVYAAGGGGGAGSGGGGGGTSTINSPAMTAVAAQGTSGAGGAFGLVNPPGGDGGGSLLYGAPGQGSGGGGGGSNAVGAGSGGQGGGGASGSTAGIGAGGGGAGGYAKAIVSTPSGTYSFSVGTGGQFGSAGTVGFNGGSGASGAVVVTEYYQ